MKTSWWEVPRLWDGGECWIIGGGTSMPLQFGIEPETIAKVQKGKESLAAYSPHLAPIHNKHVIGVNVGYQLGDWVSICYFGDRSFFKKFGHSLVDFPNLKVTHSALGSNMYPQQKGIKKLKLSQVVEGLSTDPQEIRWNRSSGTGAINLATLLGAKRIILVGFDMHGDPDRLSHWHGAYGNFRISKACYIRFQQGFPAIAEDATKLGVEILNVNKDGTSKIPVVKGQFKQVKLQDVL